MRLRKPTRCKALRLPHRLSDRGLERRRELREVRTLENLHGTARASVLSDALLTVYCVLRDVPDEAFGGDTPGRERYAHIGRS
jgi:hypothetical protein